MYECAGSGWDAGSDNLRMSLLLSLRDADIGQLQYMMCIIIAREGSEKERLTHIQTNLLCMKPHARTSFDVAWRGVLE